MNKVDFKYKENSKKMKVTKLTLEPDKVSEEQLNKEYIQRITKEIEYEKQDLLKCPICGKERIIIGKHFDKLTRIKALQVSCPKCKQQGNILSSEENPLTIQTISIWANLAIKTAFNNLYEQKEIEEF